jgi:DNA processing protein
MTHSLLYDVALSFVPGIGDKTARLLISHFGSAEEVFRSHAKELQAVAGASAMRTKGLKDPEVLTRAEEELRFAEKHKVQVLTQSSPSYPQRLLQCADAPYVLYYRGSSDLNAARTVAVIGTRKPTDYGTSMCEELIRGLKAEGVLVVSGLAHGIDAIAHRESVRCGLHTVGVLAHGLHTLYPPAHQSLAKEMMAAGGVLTEFCSGTKPDRGNFPVRNRVVAGMSDVTIVVESDIKGGAMITAYLAHGYNREVAAYPGRVGDTRSAGCNQLIRRNVAALITSADDVLEVMNWKKSPKRHAVQPSLALAFTPDEAAIVRSLEGKERVHADELLLSTGLGSSGLASALLQLELQGIVKSLAGKWYRIG